LVLFTDNFKQTKSFKFKIHYFSEEEKAFSGKPLCRAVRPLQLDGVDAAVDA
jgi:hypothetical protein